jgi:CBS domain-containing protein
VTVKRLLDSKGRAVATAAADVGNKDIVALLASKRIGAVVIVDDDRRVEGIVSERDVVRALSVSGAAMLDQPVSTIMTRVVETCAEADRIGDIMRRMTEGKFRHVPVVDASGRLDGIVSIGDVVKHRVSELEAEANAMRDYIVA